MLRSLSLSLSVFVYVIIPYNIADAQSGLSQNSGINSADTWVAATVNISGNGSVTLASPVYNPQAQTTSSTLPVSSSQTFNLEAGYDANGGMVINLYPISSQNPLTNAVSAIGSIRYAGGQMTIFDQAGNLIPLVMPNANTPVPSPLAFLGTNPGASVIGGLVIPKSLTLASPLLENPSISYSPDGTSALLQGAPPSGGSASWSYATVGSNWVAQSVTLTSSLPNATTSRTTSFSNVAWNDNATNDAARAGTASTIVTPPAATTNPPPALTIPSPTAQYTPNINTINPSNCITNVYSLGGAQNVVMQHGLNSSSCAWTRMANWLNQDFLFGTEIIPSLSPNDPLASQGQAMVSQVQSTGGNG